MRGEAALALGMAGLAFAVPARSAKIEDAFGAT